MNVIQATATAVLSLGLLAVVSLMARRIVVSNAEIKRRSAEQQLQPLALALVSGEPVDDVPGDPSGQQVLAAMLTRYARQVSGESREHLIEFFEQHGAVAVQLDQLKSKQAWRRATAAYALGDMRSPQARSALEHALDDRDVSVRFAAARSLGRVGDQRSALELLRAYEDGRLVVSVCGEALIQLGVIALPAVSVAASSETVTVRRLALQLLGQLAGPSEWPLLAKSLTDPSADCRAAACVALGELGDDRATRLLAQSTHDRIPKVRASAAEALGRLGDPSQLDALLTLLSSDFDTARAAAVAAARLDPERVVQLASLHSNPHLREQADRLKGQA